MKESARSAMNHTTASFTTRLRAKLALTMDDAEIAEMFKEFTAADGQDTFELFHVVASVRSIKLALTCLSAAFPNPSLLGDSLRQDLAIVKLTMVADDRILLESQKVMYTRTVLEAENLQAWSGANLDALRGFLHVRIGRCIKCRFFEAALDWIGMCKAVSCNDVASGSSLTLKLAHCYLEMGKFEEAEAELLTVPITSFYDCTLRIQLSIKQGRVQDAITLIRRLVNTDGVSASDLLSLIEGNPVLIKLAVYQEVLKIEPANASVAQKMLTLVESTTELSLSTKIGLVLSHMDRCRDGSWVKKMLQNMWQIAIQHEMYAEATTLFEVYYGKIPETNTWERFLANFFKCQAVYENSKHAYDEADYQDLKKLIQLSEKVYPKFLSKGMVPCSRSKQEYQAALHLFAAKASIYLCKWDDMCVIIGETPSRS